MTKLDPIGLENFKDDVVRLANWAYAGATTPEDTKEVAAISDNIIGTLAEMGAFDEEATTSPRWA